MLDPVNPFDPAGLNLPPDLAKRGASATTRKRKVVRRNRARFVKGPIPFEAMRSAHRAHRAGLPILLCLKIALDSGDRRCVKDGFVKVTADLCDGLGISARTRQRAILALEAAGLVRVKREGHAAALVRPVADLFQIRG